MKRILGLSTLAALLMTPCMAQADEVGLYVAPKLGYGKLKGYDVKVVDKFDGDTEKISVSGDNVFGGGIAVGYDFHKRFNLPLRAELEYAGFNDAKDKYKESFTDGYATVSGTVAVSVGAKTLFANAYYDFRNNSKFTPYVGLGLGGSFLDTKVKLTGTYEDPFVTVSTSETIKKSNNNFAWNVSGGVAYAFTSNISLDLAYRYANLGKIKYSDEYEKVNSNDLGMHQVMVGLRVAF
jgi:outer membrane autotransporter protein